jgi:hypothetical protein
LRLLKSILNFQLKKAINKRNALVFFGIAVILQVFLQVGKANHSEIFESKDTFQSQEKQKASGYLHYRQYGIFGIWLMLIPHVNSILYFDSTCDNLLCNENSTYVFNIYKLMKGRRLFANRSQFLNFSAMFLLFGVLACLVYGKDTIVRKDYLKFISNLTGSTKAFWFTVTARLVILFSAVLVLYAISVLPLLVFDGINLFITSFPVLCTIILVFFFFFSIGCVVGLKESQFTRTLILGAVYFISVILLPWVMDLYAEISAKDLPSLIEFDFRNFNVLMQEEGNRVKEHGLPKANETPSDAALKDFKDGFKRMIKIFRSNEDRLKNQTMAKIKTQKTISALFPTLFYFSTWESSSGTGVDSYMDFHTYCQEKKDKFSDFIRENSFPEKDKPLPKVESFLKGDEDLFFSKPKLPYNFGLGVFLTPFYTVLLLLLTFSILKKRLKVPAPAEAYEIEKEDSNTLFVLCENEKIKSDIFNYYQNQKGSVCLEKIDTGDFQFYGIKSHELFNHFCHASGVDEKKAIENMEIMGIRDLRGLPVNHENTSKIIVAVTTAADRELIVINDLLKNESRELEKDLFNLLLFLEKAGKKIIYLSCQMKHATTYYDNDIKFPAQVNGFKAYPLDFNNTTVR